MEDVHKGIRHQIHDQKYDRRIPVPSQPEHRKREKELEDRIGLYCQTPADRAAPAGDVPDQQDREQELRQALELRLVDNARLAAKSLDRVGIDTASAEADWQTAVTALTDGNPGLRRVVVFAGSTDARIVLADSDGPGSPLGLPAMGRPIGPVVLHAEDKGFNAAAPLAGGERMVVLSVATDDIQGKLSKLRTDSAGL